MDCDYGNCVCCNKMTNNACACLEAWKKKHVAPDMKWTRHQSAMTGREYYLLFLCAECVALVPESRRPDGQFPFKEIRWKKLMKKGAEAPWR